jgi:hypothetical protein
MPDRVRLSGTVWIRSRSARNEPTEKTLAARLIHDLLALVRQGLDALLEIYVTVRNLFGSFL